jgi:hypothetical protein
VKLYEIPNAYRSLMQQIEDADGELSPEVEQSLDGLQENLETKIDSMCCLVREAESEAESFDTEIKRLQAKKKAAENRAENLKLYMSKSLQAMDLTSIKTPKFSARIQQAGRPSIKWTGLADDIPERLRRTKVELDGNAAYEAWKKDSLTDHRFQVVRSRSLIIR